MASEKKTAAAAPIMPPLHNWTDAGGVTVCRVCGQRAGIGPDRCLSAVSPAAVAGSTAALEAEVDRLTKENDELRKRLADAKLPPLQTR